MARGLIGAAMLSGAGQGLANAAGTGIQIYGTMMLQQQREQMEERKLKLMEQFASEREQRGYDFQRGMQQEKMGAEILSRGQDRQERSDERAKDREFQGGQQQERIGADIVGRTQDREFHKEDRAETIKFQRDKMASDERQHQETMKAQKAHWDAIEKHAARQYGDKLQQVLVNPKNGNAYALMSDGSSKPITDENGNPISGKSDLPETAKELSRLHVARGEAYLKIANDPLTSADDRTKNLQLSNDAYAQAASYLSEKPKAPAGSVQIKDRFASQQGGQSSPQPSVPAADDISQKPMARGERTVPAATVTASPTDALSEGFGKVVDRTKGLIANATDALMPSPVAPEQGITRESKADAMASIKGNTTELLAQKREETAQRAAAAIPEQSKPSSSAMGLLDSAQAASPKKAARPPAGTSGLEWAQSLPPEDQQSLRRIIAEYQAGKRTRDEFISGVISMSESGTQGLAIAEGMLRNLDRGAK